MIWIKQKNRLRAFTLIELLVVVAIIGILSTVVVVNVSGARASSRYAKTVSEMTEMAKAVTNYRANNNSAWPDGWMGYYAMGTTGTTDSIYKYNNYITGATANRFLVDYLNSKIPTPVCSGGYYGFYSGVSAGGYAAIMYFPPTDTGHWAAKIRLDSDEPSSDIHRKVTKSITCKEGAGSSFMES